ncbi:Hypothetical protein DPCES_1542 [Desulfitobacterium hafniense]|uniref:DUF7736 domain-containing protein n=2 Tax=Desulfitobacterium hafniense TaxID=49338 RepID=A0A098AXU4_DESHA|nr:Hypothetical protein DPCES_1542 [Desulfitobacterium hafniense]
MMTKEEATAKSESRWYEGKSPQEIVEFQLYEDKLCMPLQLYQEAVEKVLGRPVYTHEYKTPERLIAEYEAIKSADGCQLQQGHEMA